MRTTSLALGILVALSIPVLLITTNVRLVANSMPFYEYGMRKYNAEARSGIALDQLLKGGGAIITYFNDETERLDVTVEDNGVQAPLFNEREIAHMRDVKALMRAVYTVQALTVGLLVAFAAYAIVALSRGYAWGARQAGLVLLLGGGGAAVLVAILGGLAAGGLFETLFIQFHLLSFSNDLWLLDPRTDHLIQMFSGGFFFEATLLVALGTFLEGIVVATLGALLRVNAHRLARLKA